MCAALKAIYVACILQAPGIHLVELFYLTITKTPSGEVLQLLLT